MVATLLTLAKVCQRLQAHSDASQRPCQRFVVAPSCLQYWLFSRLLNCCFGETRKERRSKLALTSIICTLSTSATPLSITSDVAACTTWAVLLLDSAMHMRDGSAFLSRSEVPELEAPARSHPLHGDTRYLHCERGDKKLETSTRSGTSGWRHFKAMLLPTVWKCQCSCALLLLNMLCSCPL